MSAAILGLFHAAIKTADLDATRRFYVDVLGLAEVARPDFGYPGAWFGVPVPGGQAIIHIYAGGPALGTSGEVPFGSAAVDHVSLVAVGYAAFVARFRAAGIDWREFVVPGTTLLQLFVYDPSGVQLEITFDARQETDAAPDLSDGRRYVAGQDFARRGG